MGDICIHCNYFVIENEAVSVLIVSDADLR